MQVARSPLASKKNRYYDIIPFDRNRVILNRPDLGEPNTYINASWIDAPFQLNKRYIATQGPIPSTIIDFWRMVVENNVGVIVCLAAEKENGMEKCARYWPTGSQEVEVQFPTSGSGPQFSVNASSRKIIRLRNQEPERTDNDACCIVRRILVEFIEQTPTGNQLQPRVLASQTVTQLQFLGWADHGVPETADQIFKLIGLANQYQSLHTRPEATGPPPMIVHCSAGCGRTGTFCLIDCGMELISQATREKDTVFQTDKNQFDLVYEVTDAFRDQRSTMVQASSQFLFCYEALWEYSQRH
ncbi:protein-tyrosine phosphatase-like protein [Radiomyces spectabilis]|uniref:protein-tyrosine phosphatase-like protein n=1 Tax=Radiomyces spectabilis TaxID=64574 RepID=UPI00221EEE9F|nr:protein-tyrosine phosphatase-like protein [Radiomyces spectabilis]KAI8379433.1 protein-tyrosine phosphatase-like protein [Radiomyces spectabilis]